jgi:hypothetical protein
MMFPANVVRVYTGKIGYCIEVWVKEHHQHIPLKHTYIYIHTYIQTHSIDPSSIQDGMNMKLVTKKNRKERRGRCVD